MMHRMKVAATLLAMFAVPAMAASQASVSLGNFSTTLKDLNTSDGIAPTIAWSGSPLIAAYSLEQLQTGWDMSTGSPLWGSGLPSYYATNGPGSIDQVSPLGYGTQHISATNAGLQSLSATAHADGGQAVVSQASLYENFTLSAGTQVTFRLTLDGSWAGTSFTGPVTPLPNGNAIMSSYAGANAYMQVGQINSAWNGSGSAFWPDDEAFDSSVEGQVLTLTLKNNSASEKSYALDIVGTAVVTGVAAPVPEPSSYAMLGAGLALLGVVARRRRG